MLRGVLSSGGTAPVGGSGTAGTIPVWSTGTTLGNSGITDNGTTVSFVSRNLASTAAQTWTLASSTSALNIASGLLNLDTTNNRIGVNQSSPTATLEVKRATSGTVMRIQNAITSGFTDTIIAFNAANTATSTQDAYIDLLTSNGNPYEFMLGSASSVPLTFRTAGTERARIDTSGNVGIGTASPSSLGANYTTLDIRGSSGGGFKFGNATQYAYMYADASGFALSTQTNLPLNLYTNNAQLRASVGSTSLDISSTSGYGLKLPATPGNADTQTLDAYQENGSWTPTLSGFGGTAPTVTSARWTRMGRMVFCELLLSSTGTFSSTVGTTTVSAPATAAVEAAVPTNFSGGNSGVGAQSGTTVYLPTVASSTLARITWQFSV